jgi:hypothetical protein
LEYTGNRKGVEGMGKGKTLEEMTDEEKKNLIFKSKELLGKLWLHQISMELEKQGDDTVFTLNKMVELPEGEKTRVEVNVIA